MTQARSAFEAVLGTDTTRGVRWAAPLVLGLLLLHVASGLRLVRRSAGRNGVQRTAGDLDPAALRFWLGAASVVFAVFHVVTLADWGEGGRPLTYDMLAAAMASTWFGLPLLALVHALGMAVTALYGALLAVEGFAVLGWLAHPRRARVAYGVSFTLAALAFAVGLSGILALATGSWLPWVGL